MKSIIIIISLISFSSCKVLHKTIVQDDGKQVFSVYDSQAKKIYTCGFVESKNQSYIKEYKNNKLKNQKVFPGHLFYIKIIDGDFFGLLTNENNRTELVQLNNFDENLLHIFNFRFDEFENNFDISIDSNKIFVHNLTDTNLVTYEILNLEERKQINNEINANSLIGFSVVDELIYTLEKYENILRLGSFKLGDKKINEISIFTTNLDGLKVKTKVLDSECFIICTGSTFKSEIWKFSLKNSELEYIESILPVTDVIKIKNKYYATYLNSLQLYTERTSIKEIKTWRGAPF